ncbi:MAG: glutathione S-transferase family protein [Caulobacterales bacterium]
MKLYSANLSPFATRVRLAIYAKGLDIDIVPPAGGGLKSQEYLAINPLGRIPTLVTDDGTVIPESDTILEYLEDAFPQKPLRPASAEDRARARLVSRVAELYVMANGQALFQQMNPATRDAAAVDAAFAKLDEGLTSLNVFLGDGPYAVGKTLTTADCSIAPLMFFLGVFAQAFGRPDVISKHAKVAAYAAHLQTDPIIKRGMGEMQAALAERMAAAR